MKANKSFKMEEDAVSPVIGVILMVAITVVLAAVVFVLVSDLGGDSEIASFPQVKLSEATTAGNIAMEHRGGDCIVINDYTFQIDGAAATVYSDAAATTAYTLTSTFCVGQTLYLDGTDGTTHTVKVIDKDAQSVVFERTITV